MAVVHVSTSDNTLNGYLNAIRLAENGREARPAMARSVERCHTLAAQKAGGAQNNVTPERIAEHTSRIRNAVFGEEVRDALRTVITLVYSAGGTALTSQESIYLKNLTEAQTGEDLKNAMLQSIARCWQDACSG